MYQSLDDDEDILAALGFDQINGVEDPYGFQDNIFSDFGTSGVNLNQEQERVSEFDSFTGNFQQVGSFRGENNDLRVPYNGVGYSSSIGSSQQVGNGSFRGRNDDLVAEQVCCGVVEINSSSSGCAVKEEQEHVEEECSRKRGRTGSCSKPGTKAGREKLRREQLNDKFMDLSSVLEPMRTPKTDKSAIIDDAVRAVKQLRGEANELKDTNQKLLEEIKSLKAEKNELREEKMVLKADKEKIEQQLKSMAVPSPGFMPSHPAAFHPNKMAVYPSYGYYPNMPPMWPYLHPADRDTSHDHLNTPRAA